MAGKIDYTKILGFILGPLVFIALASTQLVDPTTGQLVNKEAPWAPGASLGLMLWTIIWWVTGVLPYGVTGLMVAIVACALIGLNPKAFGYTSASSGVSAVLQTYFSETIWVFFGGFLLGWGMEYSGFAKRLTRKIVGGFTKISKDAFWTVFAMWFVTWFISWWMSNTAATAVVYPLLIGLIVASPWINEKQAEISLIFLAFAASFGGVATIIGTPPNLIAAGFVESQKIGHVGFMDWLTWGVPLAVISFAVMAVIGKIVFGKSTLDPKVLEEQWKREPLGKMTLEEKWFLVVFVTTVFLWIFKGVADIVGWSIVSQLIPSDAIPALVCAVLLFGAPKSLKPYKHIFSFKEGIKGVEWDTLFLFAGGLVFGSLLFKSGAGLWLGKQLTPLFGTGVTGIALGSSVTGWVIAQFTSHTAASNAICPIVIALGQAAKLPNSAIAASTIAAAIATSFAIMFPFSTPPNAIVYGSGKVRMSRMALYSVIVSAVVMPIMFVLLRMFFGF